jgi:hypothetical protein
MFSVVVRLVTGQAVAIAGRIGRCVTSRANGRISFSAMLAVVVRLVTGQAVAIAGRVEEGLEGRRVVAADTRLISVHSEKIESTRDRRMVEFSVTPGGRCVTGHATLRIARSLMGLIVPGLMARHTIGGRLRFEPWLEGLGNMAEQTWQAVVDSQELKPPTGVLVIKYPV